MKDKIKNILLAHSRNNGDYVPDYEYEKVVDEIISISEFHILENKIIKWADERNVFVKSGWFKQFSKTMQEVNELFDAISDTDKVAVKDAIGDVVVTLIIQAKMWDLNLQECLEHAYNEIKDRKGKMVNGMFVKEEN